MKTFKRIKNGTVVVILAALLTIPFQSCKKYPDGPFISLRSRTARLCQTWRVENVQKNGADYTNLYYNYTETFTRHGDYSYTWDTKGGTSIWTFQNKDDEIVLNGVSAHSYNVLIILRLEEKSFWYYYMDGSDRYEFHMIPD